MIVFDPRKITLFGLPVPSNIFSSESHFSYLSQSIIFSYTRERKSFISSTATLIKNGGVVYAFDRKNPLKKMEDWVKYFLVCFHGLLFRCQRGIIRLSPFL